MAKAVFILMSLFVSLVQASQQDELMARLNKMDGQVFSAPGPNCFATALKLAGITRSFRGMDEPEFRHIVHRVCEKVDVPKPGDIGVFEKPGFGFIHAYVFVSSEIGMQKPGVDYAGQTPIAFVPLSAISYTYLASPECRRYSKNISECANENYYLRCQSLSLPETPWVQQHEASTAAIEKQLDILLLAKDFDATLEVTLNQLSMATAQVRMDLEKQELTADLKQLLSSRVVSIEKQIKFFSVKVVKPD